MKNFKNRSVLFWVAAGFVFVVTIICIAEVMNIINNNWDRLIDSDGLDAALSSVLLAYSFIYFIAAFLSIETLTLAFAVACLMKGIMNIVILVLANYEMKLHQIIVSSITAVIRIATVVLAAAVSTEIYNHRTHSVGAPFEHPEID